MEKILYVLWRDAGTDQESFAARLRTEVAERLLDAGAHGLQINVTDAGVAAGSRIQYASTHPQMEAVLHVWVDCSIPRFRRPFDEIVAGASDRFAAYLTTEAYPVPYRGAALEPGARSPGWAQIGFGRRRPDMAYDEWIRQWQRHTDVAMTHQPLLSYQQNEFVRALTPDAPDYHSMVEECFPIEALTDPRVYFDAAGDEEKYQRNFKTMMDSVMAFADLENADVFPTSQYVVKRACEA